MMEDSNKKQKLESNKLYVMERQVKDLALTTWRRIIKYVKQNPLVRKEALVDLNRENETLKFSYKL